jgi:hypothetical protein
VNGLRERTGSLWRRWELFTSARRTVLAVTKDFGTQQPKTSVQVCGAQPELGQARAQFDEAQKAMQHGDWGGFGKAMNALKRLLAGSAPPKIEQ